MTLSTQTATAQKPVRVLVIQLARLGDTLQSLMALRAAKQLYPQLEIHFLAREQFAGAAKRIPWLKSVFTFPSDSILGPLLKEKKNQAQTVRELAVWLGPVIENGWDFAVNWSYSEASSFLTALIPARIKLGYSRRKDGSFAAVDGWSHYIQAIVQGKISQNIHLTDILTTQLLTALQIHIGDPQPNGDSPVTSKAFFSLSVPNKPLKKGLDDPSKKWIGIQLSRNPDQMWNAKSWGQVAGLIAQRNPEWNVVLLGEEKDRKEEELFFKTLPPSAPKSRIVSLVGETDFDAWVSVICRCQWLFSGDTAAVHLASVLGTRVLNVSRSRSIPLEIGPYGNGHYVLTPLTTEEMAPEAAYAVWTYASQEWIHRRHLNLEAHFSQLGWGPQARGIRVARSNIRNTQDGGGAAYEPLLGQALELEDWTAMVIGHIARSWYCGWVPPIGQEIKRDGIYPSFIQKLRGLEEATEVLNKICEKAVLTAEQLTFKGSALKSEKLMGLQDREEIQALGKTLAELEALMDRIGTSHPPMLAFVQMVKVLMHNLKGNHLSELGKETAQSYKRIQHGISVFKDWISHTLELAKPVAVSSDTVTPLESGRNHRELSP